MAPNRFNLSSAGRLRRQMNQVLAETFAQQKYYQLRFLTLLIGFSKIFHAIALMYMYMQQIPFSEKYKTNLILSITGTLTYVIQYGISMVWWKHYYGTFARESSPNNNLIVCIHTPWYTGKYVITIYLSPKTTYFQRLTNEVYHEEIEFANYFTESGYFLEEKWKAKVLNIYNQSLYAKNK